MILLFPLKKNQNISTNKNNINQWVSLENKTKINTFCDEDGDEDNFCSFLLSESLWNKIYHGKASSSYAQPFCLNKKQEKSCLKDLITNPKKCLLVRDNVKSNISSSDCNSLSTAITYGQLYDTYEDCPGQIGNLAVNQLVRIINHFKKDQGIPYSNKDCSKKTASQFIEFMKNAEYEEQTWGISYCYDNKILADETCSITLLENLESSPYSEERIISKILSNTRGTTKNLKCKHIDEKIYGPNLLKYQVGCFMLFNKNNCSATMCPKKIVVDGKFFNHIKTKYKATVPYLALTGSQLGKDMNTIVIKKLDLKQKTIKNFFALKNFISEKKKNIVHGMGCLEDIIREQFYRKNIGDCTPVPFIIDGILPKNKVLITRVAIDRLRLPRSIYWGDIYNAVRMFQKQNHTHKWTLYGLSR